MTDRQATVAVHYVRLLTDYCERQGLPAAGLFRDQGLEPALLDERDARLPYAEFQALLERAATRLKDPCLGLHVGAQAQPGYYGPYGFTLMTCRSAQELLVRSVRYSFLVCDAYRIEVVRKAQEGIRYWRSNLPGGAAHGRLHEQLNAAAWLTMARWVTAQPRLSLRWISFRHSVPDDVREYEAMFRCPLRFGAQETSLGFDLSHLDLPLTQADPEVSRMMEAVCQRLEQRLGSSLEPPWFAACRQAIVDALGSGEPEPAKVAATAGLGLAELRQRLAARRTSFRKLVGELQRELALSYLQDPSLSLIDIACLTGFSEQSAFQRAFKRWTGRTPGEYRRQGIS